MWRITKDQYKIVSITQGSQQIDGFIILPGVTQFASITIVGSQLVFLQADLSNTIVVYFHSKPDLERFLVVFERDHKIEALLKNNDGK